MSTLSLNNIVTISVAQPPTGLSDYRINNLALFTKEVPVNSITNFAVYLDAQSVGDDWGVGSETYAQAVAIFSQQPNILSGGGRLIVVPMQSGDTLTSILAVVSPLIYFGGVIYGGYAPNDAEILAAATAFQAAQKLLFASQYLTTALNGGGVFATISAAKEQYCRMLLYTPGATQARLMAAAYASRAMSTDFSGSNTTGTMHMKDLIGITPDPAITQTILTLTETVGADVYTTFGPLPKVFSTGGNGYFDQVYGTLWLVFALQVAVFNAIATTPTKVPQTEPGIAQLRNAASSVCQQAVTNGFSAPGAWNSPQTFGDPQTLIRNILQRGWYVYTAPVNLQSQTQREARIAPLMQIALKLAGAVQSVNVIVYINP